MEFVSREAQDVISLFNLELLPNICDLSQEAEDVISLFNLELLPNICKEMALREILTKYVPDSCDKIDTSSTNAVPKSMTLATIGEIPTGSCKYVMMDQGDTLDYKGAHNLARLPSGLLLRKYEG
ncbi:hypothetical protein Bbelb_186840 [Branchiostoma belcheri]|nr:hypothetical protein Bbelb_186840 [Branchiostoma belcheri]